MTLAELQSLIGSLTNDPNHDRYSTSDINTELDNSQNMWNVEAKIIKFTDTLTVVDGTRQYSMAVLPGAPISFTRVTHKGIDLAKRSKTYFDHLGARDWTQDIGTPTEYFIDDATSEELGFVQYLTLHPTPQSGDTGAYLVVEYCNKHTPMTNSTDVPLTFGSYSNYLIRPYDWGLAYSVAAKLLLRDPSNENSLKSANYANVAKNVLDEVVQVFRQLEKDEPRRMSGGRYWNSGNVRLLK